MSYKVRMIRSLPPRWALCFLVLVTSPFAHAVEPGVQGGGALDSLPSLTDATQDARIAAAVASALKGKHLGPGRAELVTPALVRYLSFLGLGGLGEGQRQLTATVSALMNSSLSFVYCADLNDWACLESSSPVLANSLTRQDTAPDLGEPVPAGVTLNLEYFFNQGWNTLDPMTPQKPKVVAETLAAKIQMEARKGLYFAIYGIDDIQNSLKRVYDSVIERLHDGATIQGVQDIGVVDGRKKIGALLGLDHSATTDELSNLIDYSAIAPIGGSKAWIYDTKFDSDAFQYNDSAAFARALNQGITSESESRARLENPDRGIMHNKFMVFEDLAGSHSVWTGTANISRTCIGQELNSNMSVFIRNDAIARLAYRAELTEMFNGAFHLNKRPNTKRYFTFDDGTEVRVHFSPTDDSIHRSIIPLLLSARAGDEIRVSMFGANGLEAVRAFQYAVARGVKVRIVVDRLTGNQVTSWHRDQFANIFNVNPYAPGGASGSIELRSSAWAGLNHQKIGTLTRKLPDGTMRAETILLGSQNWSAGGNDLNDENMLSIRNQQTGLAVAEAFNRHFDQELWGASTPPQMPAAGAAVPMAAEGTAAEAKFIPMLPSLQMKSFAQPLPSGSVLPPRR